MGFEMSYQAIPPNCGLIELARSDIEVGESLMSVPYWFTRSVPRPAPGREDDKKGRLWNWCCWLAGRHPELFARNCDLDRGWDELHYLLSATRRDEPVKPSDQALNRAFDTGELVAEHARGGQGVPIRFLSPAAVRDVAEAVRPMSHASLIAHYYPARMEAAAVYKFRADRADEAEWMRIVQTFGEFQKFFLVAADVGDAVIVVRD